MLGMYVNNKGPFTYGTNQRGWERSQYDGFLLKCLAPPWDQNGLCVEVNLLSQVTKARGSPKMSFIPRDHTWMTR